MKMEIIAALLHRPKIILLDEPTLGLDVISQAKIREFVKYYNTQHNTTFVITSHYTKDIQEMCNRVFVLNKGKSIYDGDFKTLIKNVNPERKLIFEFIAYSCKKIYCFLLNILKTRLSLCPSIHQLQTQESFLPLRGNVVISRSGHLYCRLHRLLVLM